jgi:hypothetical protein
MSGGVVEYSVGSLTAPGAWISIPNTAAWPVTITNSNPGASSILNVVFTQSLTFTTSYGDTSGYFITGSSYITFDGAGYNIIINGIENYLGLIRNGTSAVNGKANIGVQNINTSFVGNVSLANGAGWICQTFFGKGASGNSITNCTNTSGGFIGARGGGIAGESLATNFGGVAVVTNCRNYADLSGNFAGGIVGTNAGLNSGSVTISGCTNYGNMINTIFKCGGIAGGGAGTTGIAVITSCTNYGNISSLDSGGMSGDYCGSFNGSMTCTACMNFGNIGGNNSGGILGSQTTIYGGLTTISNCSNTGVVSGINAGGIVGYQSVATIINCFNAGVVSGNYAGGIAGSQFAYNTIVNGIIRLCYSTGNINGNNAGGIVGADPGFNETGLASPPVVDISNCYSVGVIGTTTGGICGGLSGLVYFKENPTIRIAGCYSSGALFGTGAGIVAITYNKPITQTNTYVANAAWTDASANASLVTGLPSGVGIANRGSIWTSYSAANTPYLLSSYWSLTGASQLYTPNSYTTTNNYNSPPGLYTSGTYSIGSAVETTTTSVVTSIRILSSSPYYGYYGGTFTLTNINGGLGRPISSTINASTGVITFIVPRACFLEGTKILCFENNKEVYRPIESLRKGDLVKTIYNGYLPIHKIATSPIYNPNNDDRISDRLYKCSKENYPALFEDLYITGCHSILVPRLTYEQGLITMASLGKLYVTDNHCRLMAWVDEKCEPYTRGGIYNIYHIALENKDYYMNYGIYANGLLVETCSKRFLTEMSNMRILGEEDSSVIEDVSSEENVFHHMPRLVDIC